MIDHVRGSRDSARKKKFVRRGPNDLSKLCASLPGPGLSDAAQADVSGGGECPLWEGAAATLRKAGCRGCRGALGFSVRRATSSEIEKRNHTDALPGHCIFHFIGSQASHSQLTRNDTRFHVLFLVLFCDI